MLTIQVRPEQGIKAGKFGQSGKMIIKPFEIPEEEKEAYERYFFRWVTPALPGLCWEWQGRIHNGYPSMACPFGSSKWAHRVAYALFNGPIKAGMHVDHTCRTRSCVNPEHLKQSTPSENYAAIGRRKRRDARKLLERNGQMRLDLETP